MCNATDGSATAELLLENDHVRITRWSFARRGDATGWHRHDYDYTVIPEFDGTLEIDLPEGETMVAELKTGAPYFRAAGVEHDVKSGNDFACSFVEIELLDRKG